MEDINVNSVREFPGGEYGSVEVDGVAKCTGPLCAQNVDVDGVLQALDAVRADRISIDGVFKCAGRLDTGELAVDGTAKIEGSAGAEQASVNGTLAVLGDRLECGGVECDGVIKVSGSLTAKSITVDGAILVDGQRLECDTLECDGTVTAAGQVSADSVHVTGAISAAEIVGDSIFIHTGDRGHGFSISFAKDKVFTFSIDHGPHFSEGSAHGHLSTAGLIEATTIDLLGVKAETVNGTDVTVGPGCVIENLDCNGTLSLHHGAVVKHITGQYTRI